MIRESFSYVNKLYIPYTANIRIASHMTVFIQSCMSISVLKQQIYFSYNYDKQHKSVYCECIIIYSK